MVILKIFTPTLNLTSNFETHKNVGENFREYIYKVDMDMHILTEYEEH